MDTRPSISPLITVAERLGPELLSRLVFVGGQVGGLMISRDSAELIRATLDVDVVAPVSSLAAQSELESELRIRGFRNDMN